MTTKLRLRLKEMAESIPESAGRRLTWVPFSLRLGGGYRRARRAIERTKLEDPAKREQRLFVQLRTLLRHAAENVQFFRDFYRSKGFKVQDFRSVQDWALIPVVSKAELQTSPLAMRSATGLKSKKYNTGGTSGQPLEFMLDDDAFAREWAHMHRIWMPHGYRPSHLKVTLRGKHFDCSIPLRYNAVHNELVVNANARIEEVIAAVLALPCSIVVRWVHGYPSLVAEFAHALREVSPADAGNFRSRLYGVLLGSEYPAPVYRDVIEATLTSNVVCWYGHSEMALLAPETARGLYESLPTYGFAEAVADDGVPHHRLVCTSLHNYAHPFIRYDTGDLVAPISQRGGSLAFRIAEGRVGDFVTDRQGKRHSLTAIIFGRHHPAFELLHHLQVRQDGPGAVSLLVTPRCPSFDVVALRSGLDLDDLDFDWRIEPVTEPVRTAAGKIRLLVS
mgnify:CR=1 FL=1